LNIGYSTGYSFKIIFPTIVQEKSIIPLNVASWKVRLHYY